MKTYNVEVTAIFEEVYGINAESEEDAKKQAIEMLKEHIEIGWLGPGHDANVQVTQIEEQ